ncbi:Hypothetical predicted protein [Pelobates cultripes]|uniref:Uncharacterized protein n=1 Tax=Pelobates cultripes TaxID=61616 RepID=A0AAD1SEF6_PELCU|nr:Hypothetical predicted protein [Pelobates cultripes]
MTDPLLDVLTVLLFWSRTGENRQLLSCGMPRPVASEKAAAALKEQKSNIECNEGDNKVYAFRLLKTLSRQMLPLSVPCLKSPSENGECIRETTCHHPALIMSRITGKGRGVELTVLLL